MTTAEQTYWTYRLPGARALFRFGLYFFEHHNDYSVGWLRVLPRHEVIGLFGMN